METALVVVASDEVLDRAVFGSKQAERELVELFIAVSTAMRAGEQTYRYLEEGQSFH